MNAPSACSAPEESSLLVDTVKRWNPFQDALYPAMLTMRILGTQEGSPRGKPKREAQEGSPTYLYEEVQITDQRTMTKKTALINHLVYPSGLV
jgi:hypothetical protein